LGIKNINIVKKENNSLFMKITEVKSKEGNSPLGHLFEDVLSPPVPIKINSSFVK